MKSTIILYIFIRDLSYMVDIRSQVHANMLPTNDTKIKQQRVIRSSHPKCSVKKRVLRNFAKFTGKNLCQSLFFNKLQASVCNFIEKRDCWHRYFPVNFVKFLRTPFLQNTPGRLFLGNDVEETYDFKNGSCSKAFKRPESGYFKELKHCFTKSFHVAI